MCHITVMKKQFGVLATLALVAGVTPAAMAELGSQDDGKDVAIDVKGVTLPVSLGSLEYPYTAAERGLSGECAIRMSVSERGEARNHEVLSCSDRSFRDAAETFAETLRFDPADGGETRELFISWSTD